MVEFGQLDIWVNNAGIFPGAARLSIRRSKSGIAVQDINLRGLFFIGAREAGKRMLAQTPTGGVIVNIASVSGYSGRPGLAAYVASKHGVVGLTSSKAWASNGDLQWDPRPGHRPHRDQHARRGRAQGPVAAGAELERILELEKKVGRRSSPLASRLGVPDDIARVVLFCASDLSMLMTGFGRCSWMPGALGESGCRHQLRL